MGKIVSRGEIDFTTGKCVETLDSRLSVISERLRVIKNPWTGNKRKLLTELFRAIDREVGEFHTFIDLFAGSCMVSMAAKLLGKQVLCNDLMTYSWLNGMAFVQNNSFVLTEKEKSYLINNEQCTNCRGSFVQDNYGNKRFTMEEAKFLDQYYWNVQDMFGHPLDNIGDEHGFTKSSMAIVYVLHHVMKHCFLGGRLNNGQVLADLDHRMAHVKNDGQSMSFKNIDTPTIFYESDKKYQACNVDALDLLRYTKPEAEICYIDPPYGGQQSDYAQMYAFFEEYIYQQPIDKLHHLQRSGDKFVKSQDYHKHFVELLDAASYLPCLVLSYNDSSWCKIADIQDTLGKFRNRIEVKEVDYSYQYRSRKSNAREYIIIAE